MGGVLGVDEVELTSLFKGTFEPGTMDNILTAPLQFGSATAGVVWGLGSLLD